MEQGSLRPDGYRPRIHDAVLSDMLDTFGAVEVAGPMWCGKTWTSLAFGESVTRVGNEGVRRTVEADVQTALVGTRPHVIDEWQDVPGVWDAVRDELDATSSPAGGFVLTGSSMPAKEQVHHSGAGRIATLRVRTMSLAETGESSAQVSLAGLFEGRFEPCLMHQRLEPLAESICRGGWPALLGAGADEAQRYLDAYLDALFGVNIPRRGLDGAQSRRVACSLARTMGGAVTLDTIAADAYAEEGLGQAARNRVSAHIAALEALYVVESMPGWDAPIRSKSRLRVKPKRRFTDPSLAAALLAVTPERLLADGQLFGVLFEALCLRDLVIYAEALPRAPKTPLHYYRDSDGLEVDAVIELRDGRWAAFEVKLGENKLDEAAASLDRLKRKIALNSAARNPEPTFLAVIVGAGELARFDAERGVYVIPITALGA